MDQIGALQSQVEFFTKGLQLTYPKILAHEAIHYRVYHTACDRKEVSWKEKSIEEGSRWARPGPQNIGLEVYEHLEKVNRKPTSHKEAHDRD